MDKKGGGKGKCKGGDEWQQHGSLAFLVLMLFTTFCARQRLWVDYQNYLANHQHHQNPYQTLADAFQMVNDNFCSTTAQTNALRHLHSEMHDVAETVLGFCTPPIQPVRPPPPRVVAAPGARRSVAQIIPDERPAVQLPVPPPPPAESAPPPLSAPSSLPRMVPPQDSPSVPHGSSSNGAPAKARNLAAENLARIGADLNKRSNWNQEGLPSAPGITVEPDGTTFESVEVETEPIAATAPPNAVLITTVDAEQALQSQLQSVDEELQQLRASSETAPPGTAGVAVAAEVPEPGSSTAEEKPVATHATHPATETAATNPAPETAATHPAPVLDMFDETPATQPPPETAATHAAPEIAATQASRQTAETHPGRTRGEVRNTGTAASSVRTGKFAKRSRRSRTRSRTRRHRFRPRGRSRRSRSPRSYSRRPPGRNRKEIVGSSDSEYYRRKGRKS